MDGTSRVYWVAARLPDGRAVVGMLVVTEPPPREPAQVIDLRSAPSRRTLRGERVIEVQRLGRRAACVTTPRGPGKVAYVRMAAPDFREPAAVSVVLDGRAADGRYAGTIMDAALVTPIADGAAS